MNTTEINYILEQIHNIESELHKLKSFVFNVQKPKHSPTEVRVVPSPPQTPTTTSRPSKGLCLVPTTSARTGNSIRTTIKNTQKSSIDNPKK